MKTLYVGEPPLSAAAETEPTVTIALNGQFAQLKLPGCPAPPVAGGKRGAITEFSAKSRRRMLNMAASIDRAACPKLPIFITLTYPAEWPAETATCKAHLDAFTKRLVRRFPHASLLWKLEYQRRGAPHYHLLLFNVPFLNAKVVAAWWYDIVGSRRPEHLAAGTECKRARGWGGVMHYVSKYLAKHTDCGSDTSPGRFWGVVNRADLPIVLLVLTVAWKTAYQLRRVLWKRASVKGYKTGRRGRWAGVSVYAPNELLLLLLEHLPVIATTVDPLAPHVQKGGE